MLIAHGVLLVDLLATCEITQIKLASHQHAFRVGAIRLNQELKDGVRARRMDVRPSLASDSRSFSTFEQREAVSGTRNCILALTLDKYARMFILSNL